MSQLLSIVIPTVTGREEWLERCLISYEETVSLDYEFIVLRDKKTCGIGWIEGCEKASGDLIHLSADDIEAHDGWLEAGLSVLERGFLPAPKILNPDGSLQSCGVSDQWEPDGATTGFTRVPLLTSKILELVSPLYSGHYYTDIYVSERARQLGIETVISYAYSFTHSWANVGRLDGPGSNQLARDRQGCADHLRRVASLKSPACG